MTSHLHDSLRILVRIGPETRGPYSLAQLKELGEVGVVGPATLAAPADTAIWQPLAEFPWADQVFPPRRELGFTQTQFIKLNHPDTTPLDHRAIIAFANAPLSPEATARIEKAREFPPISPIRPIGPIPSASNPAADPNDVLAIVRATTDAEAKLERETPMAKPWKPSHDFKVCATLSVLGTTALLSLPTWYDFNDPLGLSWPILFLWVGLFNTLIAAIYILSRRAHR